MTDVATKAELTKLQKAHKAAQDEADALEIVGLNAKDDAREAAVAAAKAYAELDLADWIRIQVEELDVDPDDIDTDRMIIRSLPAGPTHTVTTNGAVEDG